MDSKPFIRSSNIWRMVLSFLGPKVVLLEGHSMPPCQLMYIFDPAGNRVKWVGNNLVRKQTVLTNFQNMLSHSDQIY